MQVRACATSQNAAEARLLFSRTKEEGFCATRRNASTPQTKHVATQHKQPTPAHGHNLSKTPPNKPYNLSRALPAKQAPPHTPAPQKPRATQEELHDPTVSGDAADKFSSPQSAAAGGSG